MASQTVDTIIRDAIVREFNAFKSLPNNQDPSWSQGHLPPMNDVPRLQPISNNQKVNTGLQEVRQKIWKRLFRTRIGDFRVWFISSSIGGTFGLSSITVLKVTFHSHSRFLKKGRSCEIQWENSAFSSPKLTVPVFRAWNFVNKDSPISSACKAGNLQEVVNLFQSRQASPFDRVWVDKYDDYVSLLTLVAEGFWEIMLKASKFGHIYNVWARPRAQAYLDQSLKLIMFLVRNGLNAGEVQWGFGGGHVNDHGILATSWDIFLTPSVLPYAEDYLRLVIDQSTMDPFLSMKPSNWSYLLWLYKEAPYPCSVASIMFQQDKWILEDYPPKITYWAIFESLGIIFQSPSIYERDPEGILIRQLFLSLEKYNDLQPGGLRIQYWNLFLERLAYDLNPDMPYNTRRTIQNYLAIYIEAGLDPQIIKQVLFDKRFHIDYVNQADRNGERTPEELLEPTWAEIMGKRSNEEVIDLSIHRDMLYGALKQCHWTESDIDNWENEDRLASLAYQLFYLEVPNTFNEAKDVEFDFSYKMIDDTSWCSYLKAYDQPNSGQSPTEDQEHKEKASFYDFDPSDIFHIKIYDEEEFTEDDEYYDGSSDDRPWRISMYDYLNEGKAGFTGRTTNQPIQKKVVKYKVPPIQSKQRNISKTFAILPILLFAFLALFRYFALPFLISLLIK